MQQSDIELWSDRKAVRTTSASFITSLKTNETTPWTLCVKTAHVKQPATDLKVSVGKTQIQLANARISTRLANGKARFPRGADAVAIPAPIQGRSLDGLSTTLRAGKWIGKG